jgi:AraC-like DNA-binding protein
LNIYYRDCNESINYNHLRIENPGQADFHLHDRFEIYFFISGNVNYFIEKKVYTLHYGDLLLMNSHEIHKPSFSPGEQYERIVIHFNSEILQSLSSPSFNLLNCFTNRPSGEQNLISFSRRQSEEILKLFGKIEALGDETANGSDVLKLAAFLELLVFINRFFPGTLPTDCESPSVPEKLVPILDYIDLNLENDLSLEFLERNFYINRFHLTRLFKKITNSGLHEYIQYKRISKAKKLLAEGYNVTEACTKSGFNDYSNFLRMFKRTVGISPGQYRKNVK